MGAVYLLSTYSNTNNNQQEKKCEEGAEILRGFALQLSLDVAVMGLAALCTLVGVTLNEF
jgi:hypothetical protein